MKLKKKSNTGGWKPKYEKYNFKIWKNYKRISYDMKEELIFLHERQKHGHK